MTTVVNPSKTPAAGGSATVRRNHRRRKGILRLLVARLLRAISVLLLVSLGVSFMLDLAPGDPAYAILGEQATSQEIALVHSRLHLDDPFWDRYARWVGGMLHGDFGSSFFSHQKVLDVVAQAAPVTFELIVVALLIALVVSVPIGIYTAYRQGGIVDRIWKAVSSVLVSCPPFVTALLLVFFAVLQLKDAPVHFPASGWSKLSAGLGQNLWHVFLPSLTLALALVPLYAGLLRSDMIATLREDYITSARAKGLPTRRILLSHALRPSSFSLLTLAGISIGQLMSGAAIVEVLFGLPGLGQQLVSSINSKDVPLVQGLVMVIAIVYVFINTAVDLAYRFLDPRVAVQRRRA